MAEVEVQVTPSATGGDPESRSTPPLGEAGCRLGGASPASTRAAVQVGEQPVPQTEDTDVPYAALRWEERVYEWSESIDGVTPYTRKTYREHVRVIPRYIERLGFPRPTCASAFSKRMVEAYAQDRSLRNTTRAMNLGLLRQYLEHEKVSWASELRYWRKLSPRRVAVRRYWLTAEQLTKVMNAAVGRERVVVALAGFDGLRSDEIRHLKAIECRMDTLDPRLVFVGKKDKPRNVAMCEQTRLVLEPLLHTLAPGDRVYPLGRTAIDRDVKAACLRVGLRGYSLHDLRRTFARIQYLAGVKPEAIQLALGHEHLEQTLYYIGMDCLDTRDGMRRFEAFLAEASKGVA